MRLLKWDSRGRLVLTGDLVDNIPPYAILSHTWGSDGDEVTFADLQKGRGQEKAGYAKIRFCEERARRDGIEYIWVDTCCINKDSHVELSEAITSMFNWYQNAVKCYVYLSDVSTPRYSHTPWEPSFRESRWFTRGWTLQELLAPRVVEFFSQEKNFLGDKITLAQLIHDITQIPLTALYGSPLTQFSVAERMRWAHGRNTRKKEDRAYCLLGIFQVFMPLIYGEGDNAFHRLQGEINKQPSRDVVVRSEPVSHVSHVSHDEPEVVRSLGLCMGSAPLINSNDFVGRDVEIERIHSLLQPDEAPLEQRRVVLGGIGGMGKTQMAIAYARRHQRDYKSVIWLNATTSSILYAGIRSVARGFLAAAELATLDDEQVLAQTHEWLSHPQNTRWLLIFDNYDEPDDYDLESFCPNAGRGSIIVTTRLPDLVTGQQIRVQPLKEMDDGLKILQTRSGRQNVQDDIGAQRLVERLGGLPLALTTAGAFLRRSTITFQKYLDTYEQSWKIDPRRPLQLREYQDRTLYTTWNLSYRRLRDDDPDAADMLQLLAYFDHQELWYELFRTGLSETSLPWLNESLSEQARFESVMGTLVEYCLVEPQYTTRSYSMHSCVHDWTLGELNTVIDSRLYWYAFDCVAHSIDQGDWNALGQVRYARLARHAARLSLHQFEQCDKANDGLTMRLTEALWVALMLRDQVQLKEAEQMYKRALVAYEEVLASDIKPTPDVVNNLGILYYDSNKFEDAERMYERALAEYEKALGPKHKSTLDTIYNLGLLYYDQGKLERAEELYKQALVGYEEVLDRNNDSTLNVSYNLGRLYYDQGRFDEAEHMYKRALDGYEQTLRPDYKLTVDAVYNLGRMYYDQGKAKEAETEHMYKRALAGYEETLGPDHMSTLNVVYNLGLLYYNQGKFEEGAQLYKRAMVGYAKSAGPEERPTLDTTYNLGLLYYRQGKHEEAEQLYKRALAGYEKTMGPEYRSTVDAAYSLGVLYWEQGRLEEAEQIYKKALAWYEKDPGPAARSTLDTVYNLGLLYSRQDKYEEAEALLQRAVTGRTKLHGDDHPDVQAATDMLNWVRSVQGVDQMTIGA